MAIWEPSPKIRPLISRIFCKIIITGDSKNEKNKLTETQIITRLNEANKGALVEELCRKYSISSATYYKIKAKYKSIDVSQLKRLKELEAENRRLKAMFADVSLERDVIKEVLEKSSQG